VLVRHDEDLGWSGEEVDSYFAEELALAFCYECVAGASEEVLYLSQTCLVVLEAIVSSRVRHSAV